MSLLSLPAVSERSLSPLLLLGACLMGRSICWMLLGFCALLVRVGYAGLAVEGAELPFELVPDLTPPADVVRSGMSA